MTIIQECDLEFNPTIMVRGQWICELEAETKNQANVDEMGWENEISMYANDICYMHDTTNAWYGDLENYLHYGSWTSYFYAGASLGLGNLHHPKIFLFYKLGNKSNKDCVSGSFYLVGLL
jgi:hypothetical protein